MTISERIAKNAKDVCRYRKLNIGDIENQIGCHVGYLSRVKGKRMIPIDTGYAIADALGMTMEELIRFDLKKIKKEKRIAELKAELSELEGETNG